MRAVLVPGLLRPFTIERLLAPAAGRPLAHWVLDAVRDCGLFEEIAAVAELAPALELPSAELESSDLAIDAAACWLTPQLLHAASEKPCTGALGDIAPLGWRMGRDLPEARFAVPAHAAVAALAGEEPEVLDTIARRHGYRRPQPPIRLFVTDVDGVLTDAGFYYDQAGEALKKFNTRDGAGLVHLVRSGIEVGIITGERTGFTTARAAKLGIKRIELGCSIKLPVLDDWRTALGLQWSEVAYIGDDLPDIPALRAVGASACPADAEPEVKAAARFVLTTPGGQGAVREFIRLLQAQRRVPPSNLA